MNKQTNDTVVSQSGQPKQLIDADAIRAEAEESFNTSGKTQVFEDEDYPNLFKIKTANLWLKDAKKRPVPKMLFGEFWFEGEICILFADTNVGKSILAVQIADAISKGNNIGNIEIETDKQKVIYFDFELSDKQFEARYSEKLIGGNYFTNHFNFDANFIRAEINPNAEIENDFATFEDYLKSSLNYTIANAGAKVLIIDNLTYLNNENEKARDALPLMKHLKALKTKYNLSILALAHTPKRDSSKPITNNDLQGSKMLMNFCDSSFSIGKSSRENGLRYLKQIKVRNVEMKFDADNVHLCKIEKPDNFLRFAIEGFARESEHLKVITEKDRNELVEQVKSLSAMGESQRKIADELGISLGAVNKYLNS